MGVNPIEDKDLKDIPTAKNHNDSGSSINAQDDKDIKEIKPAKEHKKDCPCSKGTEWQQSEGLTKPKDDKDIKEISIAKEHSKNCPCNKDVNPPRGGGSRGLGAGATSIQGAGHSAQISEEKKDDTGVSAESLGNPDKLKKPGNSDIVQDRPSSMKCSKCGKTKTI